MGRRLSSKQNIFDDYNYEESFKEQLNNVSESFIESIANRDRTVVGYTTKTIQAGNQFEVEIYPRFNVGDIPTDVVRNAKKRETQKKQKQLNDKNSRKRLNRLVHANFSAGDYWITCTFAKENEPATLEDAERQCKNFFRRVNHLRKKNGLERAKYVYVIEQGTYGTERFHLHLIINKGISKDDIESKWGLGRVTSRTISFYGDESMSGLCKYISKDPETYKKIAFRMKGKRKWGSSKGNLKEPKESKNRTAFSRKKVNKMVHDQNSIGDILETKYKNYNFKEVEVRYNEFNGMYYIYALMHDKRPNRDRR